MTEAFTHRPAVSGTIERSPEWPYRRYFVLLAGAWTGVVVGSLAWNLARHSEEVRSRTAETARVLLKKDLFYREWSLLHGGVYVPKSRLTGAETMALEEDREIVTPRGKTLTLLNPALVSRQVFALQEQQTGIRGHLTSLKPLRPANIPDEWERAALQAFEKGSREVSSIETVEGRPCFRMMHPLVTDAACLQCHEEAGRKPGEIRGGISVTVPLSEFGNPTTDLRLGMAHLALWGIGMTGLIIGARDLRSHVGARRQAEAERERLIGELQAALANVKTLRGLIPICSSCKKIRDDQGYWTQLETYLRQHSDAEFSHGLCLECARNLYPEFAGEVEARLARQELKP